MKKRSMVFYAALLALGTAGITFGQYASAAGFNPMNMMNPSKWMGGGRSDDRYYDDYYGGGPYGYGGGPYGYGGGPYGYGGGPYGYGGGPYGYGAPGYGGAYPGYGAGAYPGYGAAPGVSAPTQRESSESVRTKELERRIRELEEALDQKAAPPPPFPSDGYTQPMGDYQSPQLWR